MDIVIIDYLSKTHKVKFEDLQTYLQTKWNFPKVQVMWLAGGGFSPDQNSMNQKAIFENLYALEKLGRIKLEWGIHHTMSSYTGPQEPLMISYIK